MVLNLFKRKKADDDQNLSDSSDGGAHKSSVEETDSEEDIDIAVEERPDDTDQLPEDNIPAEPEGKKGFFNKLRKGLAKTREILTTDIEDLFSGRRKIDDELLEELEALLIAADMGVETTMALMDRITAKSKHLTTADELKNALKQEILELIESYPAPSEKIFKPHVILVVGVNGVGKTTTIGKVAARYRTLGKKVLICAADTFRAAAIEQLSIWAERSGADIVKHKNRADPAAVAYDGIEAAISRNMDLVLIDTAGRLHTKVNLMEELKKIKRTIGKKLPGAPHEVLLILDATTGQNAISQTKLFDDTVGVTGIALAKLDGTAKGGIVVSICNSLKLPIRYIGVGEQIEDLQDFDPKAFVEALF
jgi:fused signal recognition particle receptor